PFFTRIQVTTGLLMQHNDNIDHLFSHWNIGFTLPTERVRDLTQMHQRLSAETDDKSRKVDFGKGFLTRLGFAFRFANAFTSTGHRKPLSLFRNFTSFTGLRGEPAAILNRKSFSFLFFFLSSHMHPPSERKKAWKRFRHFASRSLQAIVLRSMS